MVSQIGPFAMLCSVMAAVACLMLSLQAAFTGQLFVWYPWLFVIAAAAFASNLSHNLRPVTEIGRRRRPGGLRLRDTRILHRPAGQGAAGHLRVGPRGLA